VTLRGLARGASSAGYIQVEDAMEECARVPGPCRGISYSDDDGDGVWAWTSRAGMPRDSSSDGFIAAIAAITLLRPNPVVAACSFRNSSVISGHYLSSYAMGTTAREGFIHANSAKAHCATIEDCQGISRMTKTGLWTSRHGSLTQEGALRLASRDTAATILCNSTMSIDTGAGQLLETANLDS